MSEIIFIAEEIARRSLATGCCWSRSFIHKLPMSRSLRSISRSSSTACAAISRSPLRSAATAAEMASRHSSPMPVSAPWSASSCRSNLLRIIRTSR